MIIFMSLFMLQVSGGDIFDFINIKLGGKRGKLVTSLGGKNFKGKG